MRFGVLLAALLCLPAVPAQAAAPAPGWTQDGYGPGNTGYNPAESAVNATTIKQLKLRWTAKPGPGEPGCQSAAIGPMVLDGRMFVLDSGTIGGYDVRTGKRLWLSSPSFDAAGLAIVDGVLLGTEVNCFSQSNWDTNVVAIDPRTGKEIWNQLQSWSITSYVGDAGVFVVSGYCGTCDDAGTGTVAFRVSDGRRLWTSKNTLLAGPVSSGGRILLTYTATQTTTAVDIRTGEAVWGGGSLWSARAADPAGRQFYLWNASGLSAVRAADARSLWRVRGEAGDVAADGRRVYVASANRVNAYHATTGKLEWTRAVPVPKRPIRAGGLLYVRSKMSLVILSPATGKPVASGVPFGTMSDHVVVTGGRLFVTSGRTVRAYAR